jgi:DNA repair protein RadC
MTRVNPCPRPRPTELTAADLHRWTDLNVVAAVLGSGRREATMSAAAAILRDGGLTRLRHRTWVGLARDPEVGPRRALRIGATLELGRRVLDGDGGEGAVFSSPEAVFLHTRDVADAEREHFVTILLDARHRYLSRETISVGTLDASLVHPREVFRPAIRRGAAALVLVHNHPSGDVGPSRDDLAITRRLVEVGEVMGIPILDHVIVAGDRYRSLRRTTELWGLEVGGPCRTGRGGS